MNVSPLALLGLLKFTPGLARFQLVHTGRSADTLCVAPAQGQERQRVWDAAADRLRNYLSPRGITDLHVLDGGGPAVPDRRSGKYRYVWSTVPAIAPPLDSGGLPK